MKKQFEMYSDKTSADIHQKETLLLAQHNIEDKEHVKILEDLGWNEPLVAKQEELNKLQEDIHARTNLGKVLTFIEAEKIAIDNCCVIKPYKNYIGPVNKKLTDAIKEMCDENGLLTSQIKTLEGIYVIAPLFYFDKKKNEDRRTTENMYPVCILAKVSDHKTYSTHYYKVYGDIGVKSFWTSLTLNTVKFIKYTHQIDFTLLLVFIGVLSLLFYLITGVPSFFTGVSYGKFELLSTSYSVLKYGVIIGVLVQLFVHIVSERNSNASLFTTKYDSKSDVYSFYRDYQPRSKFKIFWNTVILRSIGTFCFLLFFKILVFLVMYFNQGPLTDTVKTIVIDGFNSYLK